MTLFRVLVFVFSLSALPVSAAEDVGAVDRARGETTAVQQSAMRSLFTGSAVQFMDTLRTGDQSRLQVTFKDGSELVLGDRSELNVDEMVYDPGAQGRGVLRLTKGVFRLVSGQVNKIPGGTLAVVTPMATIGVRGTDFWGEQSADRLKMALLDDGELTITTKDGTVTLSDPMTIVVIDKGKAPGTVSKLSQKQLVQAMATISW